MTHIAIIGSGPAGCYLAEQLLRLVPAASIDIIEQLPVPFGLIRYGVAPDHQSTKAVARIFERVLARDRVSFFGNVCVGRDVSLEELRSLYDAVVLATGAQRDRKLGIPGEDLPGVMGSGAFVGWYNGHPQWQALNIDNVQSAVIIGNGNVASDVARILAKGADELAGSDIAPGFADWLAAQPIQTIHVVGRRSAADAKFTDHELAELGELRRARPVVNAADLVGDSAVVKTLRSFTESPTRDMPIDIRFHFQLTPVAFCGEQQLEATEFCSAADARIEIPAQLAITCISYEAIACGGISPVKGCFANEQGKIAERLYAVGWAKRGPSGTIPTNRTEAQQVAQKMALEIADGQRPGGAGLRDLLQKRGVRRVDYDAWRLIDAAELAGAGADLCRRKFCTIDEMLQAAGAPELRLA